MQEACPFLIVLGKSISISVFLARGILSNEIRRCVDVELPMAVNCPYEDRKLVLRLYALGSTDLIFGLTKV